MLIPLSLARKRDIRLEAPAPGDGSERGGPDAPLAGPWSRTTILAFRVAPEIPF